MGVWWVWVSERNENCFRFAMSLGESGTVQVQWADETESVRKLDWIPTVVRSIFTS